MSRKACAGRANVSLPKWNSALKKEKGIDVKVLVKQAKNGELKEEIIL